MSGAPTGAPADALAAPARAALETAEAALEAAMRLGLRSSARTLVGNVASAAQEVGEWERTVREARPPATKARTSSPETS